MRFWRYLFAASAALFVIGVVVQVYLAGMFLFGAGERSTHIDFGYTLSIVPLLPLVLAWPARVGWRTAGMAAALLVLTIIQTLLPQARGGAALIAALHPLNAFLLVGLGVALARRGFELARATPAPAAAPESTAATAGREP